MVLRVQWDVGEIGPVIQSLLFCCLLHEDFEV